MTTGLSFEENQLIDDILGDGDDDFGLPPIPAPKPKVEIAPTPSPKQKPNVLNFQTNTNRGFHAKSSLSRPTGASGFKKTESSSSTKCITPCIGGPELQVGQTTDLASPRFCSNLICVSCDHKVIRFPNYRWNPDTNYLFLRNNYPDTVQKNLIPCKGTCAYCCQCTFCEETATKHLNSYSSTWACRGHH